MPLHQAVSQPFLQKPVHAPFLGQGVVVAHAVVACVTHAAAAAAGNDFPDLGIVVDTDLYVRCRKTADSVLEIVSEAERGSKPAALRDAQMQVERAIDV